MKELVQYLLENLYIDFQGDVSMETIKSYLREDDSPEARALLKKIIEEHGVDNLLLALADVLKDRLPTGITEDVVLDELQAYSDG